MTPPWLHPWIRVRLAVRVVAFLIITVAAVTVASCSTTKAPDQAGAPSQCNGMAAAAPRGLCGPADGAGGGGY